MRLFFVAPVLRGAEFIAGILLEAGEVEPRFSQLLADAGIEIQSDGEKHGFTGEDGYKTAVELVVKWGDHFGALQNG